MILKTYHAATCIASVTESFVALQSCGFLNLPDDYDIAHDDDDDVNDDDWMDHLSIHPCPDQYVEGCLKINLSIKNKTLPLLPAEYKELQESTLQDVNIHYLYLIDKLCKLMKSCDPGIFIDKCASLMASYNYNIPLFSDEVLKEFSECDNVPVMLRFLMCYCTWCDFSVIVKLLEICDYPEGVKLLQKFKHTIDFTKPIMEYPITNPYSLMIPSENGPYTMMVTKYDPVNFSISLSHIKIIKSLISEKCEITFISCQFLAVADDSQEFYWLIPNSVTPLIVDKVQENGSYLYKSGIKALSIYPYNTGTDMKFSWITSLSTDSANEKVRYLAMFLCCILHCWYICSYGSYMHPANIC